MGKSVKRIAVTGGAGQIAYSLLFRLAHGDLFGPDQPIVLHILEIPEALAATQGVRMELEDCAFPLLQQIKVGSDPFEIFEGVEMALLIGAKPRGPGMERGDLLSENGKIFVDQGKALNAVADSNVRVLVVGNPCNTNCLIAMHHAPRLKKHHFHAMMRLDQNRAHYLLAAKASMPLTEVTQVTIWGNHSATQVPDFYHAQIQGKSAVNVIDDRQWLENTFISSVQKRGAAIIEARGKSSAASAANAIIDAARSLLTPTKANDWFSTALFSAGNPYGIDEGLIFSFPCRSDGKGDCQIVGGLRWNELLRGKIKVSEKELIDERDLIRSYLE